MVTMGILPYQGKIPMVEPRSIFPVRTCTGQWEAELCLRTNREAYVTIDESPVCGQQLNQLFVATRASCTDAESFANRLYALWL
jgi:hypothetical protein